MMSAINVCYSVDNNLKYLELMAVSITSLILTKNADTKINIHILHDNISESNQQKLLKLNTKDCKIIFFNLPDEFKTILSDSYAIHFKSGVMYRLFIPKIFPNLARILYLDSDTLIRRDLTDLYHKDFKGNYICALKRPLKVLPKYFPEYIAYQGKKYHKSTYYTKILNLPLTMFEAESNSYLNSGVVLFNIKQIISDDLDNILIESIKKYNEALQIADQDIMVKVFGCRIEALNICYNYYYMKSVVDKNMDKAYIWHYLSKSKPTIHTFYKFNNFEAYIYYLQRSPFKKNSLLMRLNYPKEKIRQIRHRSIDIIKRLKKKIKLKKK